MVKMSVCYTNLIEILWGVKWNKLNELSNYNMHFVINCSCYTNFIEILAGITWNKLNELALTICIWF